MWLKRDQVFCQMTGIDIPIVQAPMGGGPSTPELVAAVSGAGGLGSIAAGYLTPDALRDDIRRVQSLTGRPFSVNLFARPGTGGARQPGAGAQARLTEIAGLLGVPPPDFAPEVPDTLEGHVDVVIAERVPIVSTTFGLLGDDQTARLRAGGARLVATAACVAEAEAAEAAGYDAVVVQGSEAGAHRGGFLHPDEPPLVGLMALVPQVADHVRLPVIASGGIMDGRGIAAALLLGAAAVQMGTAFLATDESGADERWKQALLSSDDTSTTHTRSFSGKPARGIRNHFIALMRPFEGEVAAYPIQNQITRSLRSQAKQRGDPEFMSLWSGQGGPLARRMGAADLIARLVEETNACFALAQGHV